MSDFNKLAEYTVMYIVNYVSYMVLNFSLSRRANFNVTISPDKNIDMEQFYNVLKTATLYSICKSQLKIRDRSRSYQINYR